MGIESQDKYREAAYNDYSGGGNNEYHGTAGDDLYKTLETHTSLMGGNTGGGGGGMGGKDYSSYTYETGSFLIEGPTSKQQLP